MLDPRLTLYHVTYAGRLPAIAKQGLRAGQARAIGASSYDAHAAKGVFLTEARGVFFWCSRARAFAEHHSDDPQADGLTPIVLAVATPNAGPLLDDPLGSRDALAPAFIAPGPIAAASLVYFNGREWALLAGFKKRDLDVSQAYITDRWGDTYFRVDYPLLPPDLRP